MKTFLSLAVGFLAFGTGHLAQAGDFEPITGVYRTNAFAKCDQHFSFRIVDGKYFAYATTVATETKGGNCALKKEPLVFVRVQDGDRSNQIYCRYRDQYVGTNCIKVYPAGQIIFPSGNVYILSK